MKLEFEGKLDGVIAEMISVLSSLGWRLVPKGAVIRMPRADEPEVEEENGGVDFDALPKKRGRPKKSETPIEPKEASVREAAPATAEVKHAMEDDDILNTPREDPDPTEELGEDPAYVEASFDAIALHRLKEETLKQLRNLYISGKGSFVRQLLAKHGHGAHVFPEVEAKHFPAIKADLDRGVPQ